MNLCEYIGGSNLYGLQTENSDIDYRGVFLHDDPLYVYGFYTKDSRVKQTDAEDHSTHELTAFLRLCVKSNTQTLECLFAPKESFTFCEENFEKLVRRHKYLLISSKHLFNSLRGYLHNELRLATGERTGKLGGKRKDSLDQYGFSPKNFSHLIRLSFCGEVFFRHGEYPVRLADYDKDVHSLCLNIKTNPENFTKEELVKLANFHERKFIEQYERSSLNLEPNFDYIRKILKYFYQ